MTTKQQFLEQKVRRNVGIPPWVLTLGLIIAAAAALFAYQSTPAPAAPGLAGTSRDLAGPNTNSVLDYLEAHRLAPAAAIDPAVQSVNDYLSLHSVPAAPRVVPSTDPNSQVVLDYLRAHGVQVEP